MFIKSHEIRLPIKIRYAIFDMTFQILVSLPTLDYYYSYCYIKFVLLSSDFEILIIRTSSVKKNYFDVCLDLNDVKI